MSTAAELVAEATKPRRVRGPRKSTLAALDAARREGHEAGRQEMLREVRAAQEGSGVIVAAAAVVILGVGFVAGALIF